MDRDPQDNHVIAYSQVEFVELTKMRECWSELESPSEWLMLNGVAEQIIEERELRRHSRKEIG